MKEKRLFGLVTGLVVAVSLVVAMRPTLPPNPAIIIAATEPSTSGSAADMSELAMVTPAELLAAGFVKQEDRVYINNGMDLESLRRLVKTSQHTVSVLPNTDSVFPEAEVKFPGGACHVRYTDLYLNPERGLDDGTNRVRVYLWFYEPQRKK